MSEVFKRFLYIILLTICFSLGFYYGYKKGYSIGYIDGEYEQTLKLYNIIEKLEKRCL